MFVKYNIQSHSLIDKFNIHKNAITLTNYLQVKLSHYKNSQGCMHDDCWETVVNHKLSQLLRANYLKSKIIKDPFIFLQQKFIFEVKSRCTFPYVWCDVG